MALSQEDIDLLLQELQGGGSAPALPGNISFKTPEVAQEYSQVNPDLRMLLGQASAKLPMTITSGMRSPEENQAVGGVPTSFHQTGDAVDIRTRDQNPANIQALRGLLQKGGYTGLQENDHLHVQPGMRRPFESVPQAPVGDPVAPTLAGPGIVAPTQGPTPQAAGTLTSPDAGQPREKGNFLSRILPLILQFAAPLAAGTAYGAANKNIGAGVGAAAGAAFGAGGVGAQLSGEASAEKERALDRQKLAHDSFYKQQNLTLDQTKVGQQAEQLKEQRRHNLVEEEAAGVEAARKKSETEDKLTPDLDKQIKGFAQINNNAPLTANSRTDRLKVYNYLVANASDDKKIKALTDDAEEATGIFGGNDNPSVTAFIEFYNDSLKKGGTSTQPIVPGTSRTGTTKSGIQFSY